MKYILGEKGKNDGSDTYQRTIEENDWETKLFSFILSYLHGAGAQIMKELSIKHIDALTPKQAIELATHIVVDLTKYTHSDRKNGFGIPVTSKADRSTTLQILEEGLQRRNDSRWEGNGVCRNFASAVKAVFEALKANQITFSQLSGTCCLYEDGMEAFDPKRRDLNIFELENTGHAWNPFVTILQDGTINIVIVDATWARRNQKTKKVEHADYTLTRMEPIIYAIGQDVPQSEVEKEERLKQILAYYILKIEALSDPKQKKERQFFIQRAVELIREYGAPSALPPALLKAIWDEYKKLGAKTDPSEIETLYHIAQKNPDLHFRRDILRPYAQAVQLSDYHVDNVLFVDNQLQVMAYNELFFRPDFEKISKGSPRFRVRMRKILATEVRASHFGDFSPATKTEDANELGYLIKISRFLTVRVDLTEVTEEKIRRLFEKIRVTLRNLNPEKYSEAVAGLSDYEVMARYDQLYSKLMKQEN